MRRLLVVGTFVAALTGTAEALTIRDIIELTRAGLGDEVLLALIEVDRGVYAIDPATLKQLKAAGVSDRVMVALVRSGREAPAELSAPMVEPADSHPNHQVVVIDHRDVEVERVREVPVAVAVPVYVPVIRGSRHHAVGSATYDASNFVPFQSGPPAAQPVLRKEEPVYWGWGGKRRPDSWDPSPEHGKVKQPDRRK
jgi:hypothetical protein